MKDHNPPAYPLSSTQQSFHHQDPLPQQSGMTLLDYFAAKAMQSYMLNCEDIKVNGGYIASTCLEQLARYSYEIAHAMLTERQKHL